MSDLKIYVGNVTTVRLKGLRDQNGNYQNNATVTLDSLQDRDGNDVDGVTTPLSLTYVAASNGDYEGTVDSGASLTNGRVYTATLIAVSAGGQQAKWVEPVTAKYRT